MFDIVERSNSLNERVKQKYFKFNKTLKIFHICPGISALSPYQLNQMKQQTFWGKCVLVGKIISMSAFPSMFLETMTIWISKGKGRVQKKYFRTIAKRIFRVNIDKLFYLTHNICRLSGKNPASVKYYSQVGIQLSSSFDKTRSKRIVSLYLPKLSYEFLLQ